MIINDCWRDKKLVISSADFEKAKDAVARLKNQYDIVSTTSHLITLLEDEGGPVYHFQEIEKVGGPRGSKCSVRSEVFGASIKA